MNELRWTLLPEELYVTIFSQLSYADRITASVVCKDWNQCLQAAQIWQNTTVCFKEAIDRNHLQMALTYGHYFKRLHVKVYQEDHGNNENACAFLDLLITHTDTLKLEYFKVDLCEQNPFFWTGGRYLATLRNLFQSPVTSHLRAIDFSKFPVAFNDDLLKVISRNIAPKIQHFNIQNKIFASRISPVCLVNFIKEAHQLKTLSIRSSYFTSDVLNVIADYRMSNLKLVSLLFTRADKFFKHISSADWLKVSSLVPAMRIELKFDHTYPMHCIMGNIMLPEVPVSILKLCLHSICYEHVNLAACIYKKTLEKLVVISIPSSDLDKAVLRIVRECDKVQDLHVRCRMDEKVVSQIHNFKQLRKYTLPFKEERTST